MKYYSWSNTASSPQLHAECQEVLILATGLPEEIFEVQQYLGWDVGWKDNNHTHLAEDALKWSMAAMGKRKENVDVETALQYLLPLPKCNSNVISG